jgi:hypothetical protein
LIHVEDTVGAESVAAVAVAHEGEGDGVERQPVPNVPEAVVQVVDQEKDRDCQKRIVEVVDVENTFGGPYIVVGMHHKLGG